jgi:hypothetical protein
VFRELKVLFEKVNPAWGMNVWQCPPIDMVIKAAIR